MNEKYGDDKPKTADDPALQKKGTRAGNARETKQPTAMSNKKADDQRESPRKTSQTGRDSQADAEAAEILSTEDQSPPKPEDDDIILDGEEIECFTTDLSNMQGAPYPEKVKEYIKNSSVAIPKHSKYINDSVATKTAFKQN